MNFYILFQLNDERISFQFSAQGFFTMIELKVNGYGYTFLLIMRKSIDVFDEKIKKGNAGSYWYRSISHRTCYNKDEKEGNYQTDKKQKTYKSVIKSQKIKTFY